MISKMDNVIAELRRLPDIDLGGYRRNVLERRLAPQSIKRLILVLSCSIFFSEMIVMLILDSLPPFSQLGESLLDSTLLSIPVFPILYFFVFRPLAIEVTERKRAEEELRRSKQEVEHYATILESSNQALEELNRCAEEATRAKSEFLANMSHEIRTPMTAILGFTDVLADSLKHSESLESVNTIKRNGEHLLGLINGILDLSKVEAGQMQIEPTRCSPVQLVADVVSLMRVRAEAKGLKLLSNLLPSLPETVLTDPLRLRQVLVNLVGNAIKFTDQGDVRIAVRFIKDDVHPLLCFDVTDTGIGMNEEQIGRLFQAFSQVDSSSTRKFGGTGLGLCISKHLAEALGGDITVRSEPGKGSTFSVTIDPGPLDGVSMIENTQEALLDQPRTTTVAAPVKIELSGRILLAEDGPDNQRLISFLLKKAGAEVVTVENGQLACEKALAALALGTPFDVILMDMQMPVMDGYTATRQLRQQGYAGPIVALTAHAMAEDRQKCLDAGCDDYATKPIDRQKLLASVAQWMTHTNEDSSKPSQATVCNKLTRAKGAIREPVSYSELSDTASTTEAQHDC